MIKKIKKKTLKTHIIFVLSVFNLFSLFSNQTLALVDMSTISKTVQTHGGKNAAWCRDNMGPCDKACSRQPTPSVGGFSLLQPHESRT